MVDETRWTDPDRQPEDHDLDRSLRPRRLDGDRSEDGHQDETRTARHELLQGRRVAKGNDDRETHGLEREGPPVARLQFPPPA